MTWIVTANIASCRIWQMSRDPFSLNLLKEMVHPESKRGTGHFLTSDKPGSYQAGDGSRRGAYSPRTDPFDVEIDRFALEIARELNHARNLHAYHELIIVAAPQMEGFLFRHMDRHVTDFIINRVQKDVMHLSPHDLQNYLCDKLK